MDNFFLVNVLKTNDNVGNKEFGFSLGKFAFTSNMITQIPSIKVVNNEIEILSILKGV